MIERLSTTAGLDVVLPSLTLLMVSLEVSFMVISMPKIGRNMSL